MSVQRLNDVTIIRLFQLLPKKHSLPLTYANDIIQYLISEISKINKKKDKF